MLPGVSLGGAKRSERELQELESAERTTQYRWEQDLARLVRAGELSIECALAVTSLYAGSLSRQQWIRRYP